MHSTYNEKLETLYNISGSYITRITNISDTQIHNRKQHRIEAHSMRHHPNEVSHMVLNGRQEWYPLCSQQLGIVLFPRLSHPCGSYLPLLHQHVIELQILILIDSLHILDQLWGIKRHVWVKSMGIGRGATCILRKWTVHRGKIMLSFPSSVSMYVMFHNGLSLRLWCTIVRILSDMSVMWLPWENKCMSKRWKENNMYRI
jgi:hypothetical protein